MGPKLFRIAMIVLAGFALSSEAFDELSRKQPDIAIKLLSALGREPEADQLLRQSRTDLEHHPRPAFVNAHILFRAAS